MGIAADIQSLAPSAIVELFELDATNLPGGTIQRFHAGTNKLTSSVTWQGNVYVPLPVEAEGFDLTAKGSLPRPKIRVANIGGVFSQQVAEFDDLIGCKLTRRRTLVKYLDAANFPSGNPTADPNQHLPNDSWFVEQKISENRFVIEWELASVFDLQGVTLPSRQIIQNTCTWKYRGPECGYTANVYYDANDQLCVEANDFCAKRLTSCKVRHPDAVLPFGGFPGAIRYG